MSNVIKFQRKKLRDQKPAQKGLSASSFGWILVGATVLGIGIAQYPSLVSKAPDTLSAQFPICGAGKRITCVVDGDTIWLEGIKIRISDIDTPEISQAKCADELAKGEAAKVRMQQLLNAGSFALTADGRDEDQYGRKLRVVTRDGQSLGMTLVSEGLAREWGGSRQPWC